MFSKRNDYSNYLGFKINKDKAKEFHHCMPVSLRGGDHKQNIAQVFKDDHKIIHEHLDIPFRVFSKLMRKQRIRENGKVVLLESDIEGRADIQRQYLEGVPNLPNGRMQDMHDKKLGQIALREVEKYNKLTGESYQPKLGDVFKNHQLYIATQKEISKEIQRLIKK